MLIEIKNAGRARGACLLSFIMHAIALSKLVHFSLLS
jgi:hypothetical protein